MHRRTFLSALSLLAAGVVALPSQAQRPAERPGPDPVALIRAEGLQRSQVMETLEYLTDAIGPRLTGSPGMKRANEWTRDRLSSWGLQNAKLEPWGPFGRGWSLERFSMQVTEPQAIPLIAYPKAWSPGTNGTLKADVVYLEAKTEADLEQYRGKLKGKIVLVTPPREVAAHFEPEAARYSDSALLDLANAAVGQSRLLPPATPPAENPTSAPPPVPRPAERQERPNPRFTAARLRFLVQEGVGLIVDAGSRGDGGTLFVQGASVPVPADAPEGTRISAWSKEAKTAPQVTVAVEHYHRLLRMLKHGQTPRLQVELKVRFHDDDPMQYNTVGEIPGSDLAGEVVMLGAHLDSWHGGTGATDNGAGVAVCMEAVRILQSLGLRPRRTIRVALWSGEEQGLHGSRAYVAEHFGGGRGPAGPGGAAPELPRKPEHDRLSAYYNLDNGTGRIRGIYLQGNEALRPIFREWLAPFRDLGASTLSAANTGSTDHIPFDSVGLPGFQFIQDPLEYRSRTHHSNMDVLERIQADDLKQASVIMAAFVYQTAMREGLLPRKPR
ncbi:MAG: M20/M25/M40 family metallo-hydrolase [Armatimonadota bacterium]